MRTSAELETAKRELQAVVDNPNSNDVIERRVAFAMLQLLGWVRSVKSDADVVTMARVNAHLARDELQRQRNDERQQAQVRAAAQRQRVPS